MQSASEISPAILAGLGRVVVKWSYLEMMTADLFTHLSKGDSAAMIVVTSNVSANSLSGWVRTLLDISQAPAVLLQETRKALAELDEMRAERNALVHGNWIPSGSDAAEVRTARLERSEILRTELVTVSDLDDAVERIKHITINLVVVLRKWGVHGY